ncbi:uncharacterized protein LOC112057236 [Bicyclus anynana]|uniref:Uncharacterized protein LOC112057236 n=1 Tax=Bicyclus anynana TaxID=110368 RepID=A0ABM3LWW1_BICAN|nr:uncharacterized protein LOC112057236 [Bicyclus anynana]
MKSFMLLIAMFMAVVMVCSSPIDHPQSYDNTPEVHRHLPVKGGRPAYKGPPPLSNLHLNLRKGEYVCGNKVCRLQPGEIPKGCNGVCQYAV